MLQRIPYNAHGRIFEIISARTVEGIAVGIFLNGRRIGQIYSCSYEEAINFDRVGAHMSGKGAAETMIDCAKGDLDKGFYRV